MHGCGVIICMKYRVQSVNMQFSEQLGKSQRTGKKHMRAGSARRGWTAHHGPSPLVRRWRQAAGRRLGLGGPACKAEGQAARVAAARF